MLCKEIEYVELVHVMLNQRQHIDLSEPCLKLPHNTPLFGVRGTMGQLRRRVRKLIMRCNIGMLGTLWVTAAVTP